MSHDYSSRVQELLGIIRAAAQMSDEQTIDLHQKLSDTGLDSLDLLSVVDALEESYGIIIDPDLVSPDTTIIDLVDPILRHHE
ncbi:MAG: acyl carrier protein [Pseudomonadota bacterium]